MRKRLVIVEDNTDLRTGFALLINSLPSYYVAAAYSNCEDALNNVEQDRPDLVLMDIDLPGMSGIEGTAQFKKLLPKVEIIVNTIFEGSEHVFEALCAGATGYITKTSSYTELLAALDEVMAGGAPMSTHIAKMVVRSFQRNHHSPLTERETEVLALLAEGKSYLHIGEALYISRETAKSHVKSIYTKLQVSNRTEAIARANRDKLI